MKKAKDWKVETSLPVFMTQANELAKYLKTLSTNDIKRAMKVSEGVAGKTYNMIQAWGSGNESTPAAMSFVGDIYSGLQTASFTLDDYMYAQDHLRILSGLYGVLKPLDMIELYRLEMGYRFSVERYKSLYSFWGRRIVESLPKDEIIINTSSVEYSKVIIPYVDPSKIITPQFYTVSPKTKLPTFVTIHSKIARGAFAHWVIKQKPQSIEDLIYFDEIGYQYNEKLSSQNQPAFVCNTFGGIGLSVRLG